MRNFWFPKGQAEYMTRNRFKELGLTDAAVGVRDRTFGSKLVVDEEKKKEVRKKVIVEEPVVQKKKETLALPVSADYFTLGFQTHSMRRPENIYIFRWRIEF